MDKLDKVERHLNREKHVTDWLGIRFFEPEREVEEVIWHLRRNTSDVVKDLLTIGIHEGHAFLIKDINRVARTYVCVHCYTSL